MKKHDEISRLIKRLNRLGVFFNSVTRVNTPEISEQENKTESQEYCETSILKDVIITDAECSTKLFYYNLSNGIRRLDKVVNTLIFCVHSIGTFCYETENSIEIKKIMEGIKNRKHFTIKYKKSSHKVIEIISETNTQEQYMEKKI